MVKVSFSDFEVNDYVVQIDEDEISKILP